MAKPGAKRPRPKVPAVPRRASAAAQQLSKTQRLKKQFDASLTSRQTELAARVTQLNEELEKLLRADMRTVTRHALREGISARLNSGAPGQTAVSSGALLVAMAFRREGVRAADLRPVLDLWEARITSRELFVAAEQLLGKGFHKLDFPRGTPLADFCEELFGSATEVGDLVAAGGIVRSIHRKLQFLENGGVLAPATRRAPPRPKATSTTNTAPDAPAPTKPRGQ